MQVALTIATMLVLAAFFVAKLIAPAFENQPGASDSTTGQTEGSLDELKDSDDERPDDPDQNSVVIGESTQRTKAAADEWGTGTWRGPRLGASHLEICAENEEWIHA